MPQARIEAMRDHNWNPVEVTSSQRTSSRMSKKTSSTGSMNGVVENNICNKCRKEKDTVPRFGVLFDVDGVLARGCNVIPAAQEMVKHLTDSNGKLRVPVAYVTNACNRSTDKARAISEMLNVEVSPENVIHSQSPLKVFNKFHDKHVLFIGQGAIHDIANELGFTNICTIEDIKEHYPLLDMVDHDNRKKVAKYGYKETDFPRVEAIIAIGEPKRWESSLQLLIDLLLTNGKPNKAPESFPDPHIPVIAANMDLQFMAEACMPRFGHGAFLKCLEALYAKITGRELHYTSLIGKPSEITYRYAEHVLALEAQKLGIKEPLKRIYFIGDNPEVDIAGANLYQDFINKLRVRRQSITIGAGSDSSSGEEDDLELPSSRCVPAEAEFDRQTVDRIVGILVGTGVYKPDQDNSTGNNKPYRGHRDFERHPELYQPTKYTDDVLGALEYIVEQEQKLSC